MVPRAIISGRNSQQDPNQLLPKRGGGGVDGCLATYIDHPENPPDSFFDPS